MYKAGLGEMTASEWELTRGGGRRTPLPPLTRPPSRSPPSPPLSPPGAHTTTGDAIDNAGLAETHATSYREWLLARGGGRLTRSADEDTFDAL